MNFIQSSISYSFDSSQPLSPSLLPKPLKSNPTVTLLAYLLTAYAMWHKVQMLHLIHKKYSYRIRLYIIMC